MDNGTNSKARTAVVYMSKYGSAEKYARWIAEDAGADLYESSAAKVEDLLNYDTLVFGGSLYAVGILGIRKLTDNYEKLKGRKLIVFSVGASPAYEDARREVLNKNLTPEMQEHVDFFMLRGAMNYDRMKFGDKALMKLMAARIRGKKEEDRTQDERDLLISIDTPADWTSRDSIAPILECIGSMPR